MMEQPFRDTSAVLHSGVKNKEFIALTGDMQGRHP